MVLQHDWASIDLAARRMETNNAAARNLRMVIFIAFI